MAPSKKTQPRKQQRHPQHKRPLRELAQRPFAIRPGGPRGISTRPQKDEAPPMPPWFRAKYPASPLTEWWCWWWLTAVGHFQPGKDFVYQDPVLGGRNYGGQVLDFVMIDRAPRLVLMINGDYWHFGQSTLKLNASIRARNNLKQAGYNAVIIWESDMQVSLDGTMRRALAGVETPLPLNVAR